MELPCKLSVGGQALPVDTDFRRWLQVWRVFRADDLTCFEKQNVVLLNTFGKIPDDVDAAMEAVLWFFLCGRDAQDDPPPERLLDWDEDWLCIWADFRLCGIDLDRETFHWWHFMALLEALPKDSAIKQRISLRATDLGRIKDADLREDYRKMKEAVALDPLEDEGDDFYARLR